VRCRAIVFNNQRKAQEVWDMARNEPTAKNFAKLAEQYSIEANSRSLGGEIPPIQKWGGQKVMEDQAFALQPGEVSGVIQVGQTFVVLFCEGYTKPVNVDPKAVRDQLYADILEKKLRLAMADTFEKIKADATIDNYLAGTTQSSSRDKELLEQDALEQKSAPRGVRKPEATVRSGLKR
jgi:DNA-binding protein YbaB